MSKRDWTKDRKRELIRKNRTERTDPAGDYRHWGPEGKVVVGRRRVLTASTHRPTRVMSEDAKRATTIANIKDLISRREAEAETTRKKLDDQLAKISELRGYLKKLTLGG